MRLSGQAKTEFEKWFKLKYPHIEIFEFEELPSAMRFGVYVDWFDSVGVYIEVFLNWNESGFLSVVNGKHANIQPSIENTHTPFKTRHEAQTKAIELANEIFNNRKV